MSNQFDLNGRVAVVTGGAQGFGRAVAERFAASGAKVDIWERDTALAEKTAGEIGAAARAVEVDVSDFASVEKARDATLAALQAVMREGVIRLVSATMTEMVSWISS